ncbi:stage IV sporulation protein B [Natronobacillus azotifigens]|uniref:SpoIVB peptidase n=1 Tax=Natronobacillus azotifigens TaxID=472978 RepID=A0A9J6REW8_9BACI|nr:SpoIVB peptidase [Natronobacillus azotifigens]
MNKLNIRVAIGTILLVTFLTMPFLSTVKEFISIPDEITVFHNGQDTITVSTLGERVEIAPQQNEEVIQAINSNQFQTLNSGESSIVYQYAGLPIKRVNVDVLDDFRVIPGGQSIGVNLETLGVLVVGHHLIEEESEKTSPGEEAGIEVGDIILKIEQEEIESMDQIAPLVEKAGNDNTPLEFTVKRGSNTFKKELTPSFDKNEQGYRIGLYIRDSAAGIGTMTFYEPDSKKYGALGHVISDMNTKKPIEIDEGSIVRSSITSIQKGNSGTPGEKRASYTNNQGRLGNITKNSPFGVFGELENDLSKSEWDQPMPIALPEQVEEGPAKILTVLEDEKVESFDIEVVNSVEQKNPATKGMVIKITDERLLDVTGGIVQGMSGSPIIQNDKVIGAVTHVFVNDPTSGYGIHIEWMLQEAGIDIYQKQQQNAS